MVHLYSSDTERNDARKVDLAAEAIDSLDLATARRLLQEVAANTPDEYVYSYEDEQRHFVKCWTLDEFRQYAAARQEGQPPAIWLSSAYPRAFYYLARIDNEEGKHEDALQHLNACLRLEPDQPLCFCEMAKSYASLGQHDKAVDSYEQALTVRPWITGEVKAMAWRGKAELAKQLGQTEQAGEFAREAETYEFPYAAAQGAPPSATSMEEEGVFPSSAPDRGVRACEVCGRRDSTLRFMHYPYIYSLIVFSFPRAFNGLWCEKHCRLRWVMASAITTILGWLGIPFGLLQTPLILFTLARGGDCTTELSVDLLKEIAEERLQEDNADGAVSCLEAALQLEEDSEAKERLSALYETRGAPVTGGLLGQVWPIPASLVVAGLVGMALGMLDYALTVATSSLLGQEEVSIYIGILAWGPRVFMAFLGAWILLRLVHWTLSRGRCQQVALGIAVAIAAVALMWYGLPGGRATAIYLHGAVAGDALEAVSYMIRNLGALLLTGGAWWIREAASTRDLWGTIYLALLLGMAAYYLTASISAALSTVRWQQRLASARRTAAEPPSRVTILSWVAVAAVVLVLVMTAYRSMRPGAGDYYAALAHMEQADEHWAAGRLDEAITEFEEAVRLQPGWAEAHAALGYIHTQQEEWHQASVHLQEAARLDPSVVEVHQALGWTLINQGELEKAVDAFQEATRLAPDLADAHSTLGWTLYYLDELERAAGAFQTAIDVEPELAEAHVGLGQVYLAQGMYGPAGEAFDRALALDVGSSDAWLGRGMVYVHEWKVDDAVEAFATAVRLGPESSMARFQLGLAYTARSEFRDAVEQFSELSNLEPDWAAPHALLASAYYELDELDMMETELQTALDLDPVDPVSCHSLGVLYYGLRQFREAEEHLLKALELLPGANTYVLLAYVYSGQGDYDAALAMCDNALELEGDEADLCTTRADIHIRQENLDLALQELQHGLEVAPDDDEVHSTLSFVYFHMGDTGKAVQEAQLALELNPYSAQAHARLAFAYREQGKLDLALAAAQESVRLAPKRDTSRFVLGVCYMDVGEREKAIAELKEFLDLYWDRSYIREYKAQTERFLSELLQE